MKALAFLIFLKISISICFIKESFLSPQILKNVLGNSTTNNSQKILNENDPEMLGKLATHIIAKELNLSLSEKYNISNFCISYLNDILNDTYEYINNFKNDIKDKKYTSREFAIKMMLDSSKTSYELTYYDSCLKMSRLNYSGLINNYTYYVILIDFSNRTKTQIDYDESYHLYAFCVPNSGYLNTSCKAEDYTKIFNVVNQKFNYSFFPKKYIKTKSFTVNNQIKKDKIVDNYILSIVIIFILLFWIFLVCARYPFFLLLKLFFRKKKIQKYSKNEGIFEDENDINIDNKYIIPKWLTKLNSCFYLSENFEELFNVKTNTASMNNYSGLTEIRGLTAISMFFTILGFTFLGVFNCPIKSTGIYQIRTLLNHSLYLFIFIGLRFSPRIIISCNGYTLMYKYLCYIDKYIENFSAFKFVIYQSYKYFLLIFFILFFRFGLNLIYVLFNGELPIWTYFDKMIMGNTKGMDIYFKNETQKQEEEDEKDNLQFLLKFIGYDHFLLRESIVDKNLIDYFWIPFNEIIFFLFGVILITIGYKHKLRIDIFILILIPITLIGKVVFSYTYDIIIGKENKKFYSTLYYYLFDYGKFMINPLFNLPYFLIGLYFGLMNYAFQNGVMNKFDSSIYEKISSFSFLEKREKDEKGDLFTENGEEIKDESKNNDKTRDNIINNSNVTSNSRNNSNYDIFKEEEEREDEKEKLYKNINNQDKKEETEEDSFYNSSKAVGKSIKTEIKHFPFLKLPIKYINFRKRNSEFFIDLIIAAILAVPFFVHYISIDLNQKELNKEKRKYKNSVLNHEDYLKILNLESYLNNNYVNAIFRVDIEFFVFFIQLFIFILQIKGRNNILSFFTNIKWGIFSKCYFSFSVVCNMVILFTIYSAESIISLNIYTIYLYFIFNTILILIYMSLLYIFFELPLKKLIKNIIYKSDDNFYDEIDDENENDNDNKNDKLEQDNIGKNNENKLVTEGDDDDDDE